MNKLPKAKDAKDDKHTTSEKGQNTHGEISHRRFSILQSFTIHCATHEQSEG